MPSRAPIRKGLATLGTKPWHRLYLASYKGPVHEEYQETIEALAKLEEPEVQRKLGNVYRQFRYEARQKQQQQQQQKETSDGHVEEQSDKHGLHTHNYPKALDQWKSVLQHLSKRTVNDKQVKLPQKIESMDDTHEFETNNKRQPKWVQARDKKSKLKRVQEQERDNKIQAMVEHVLHKRQDLVSEGIYRVILATEQTQGLDSVEFQRVWISLVRYSPIAIEVIPGILLHLCRQGEQGVELAEKMLKKLGQNDVVLDRFVRHQRKKTRAKDHFKKGLNYGLNVLMYHYLYRAPELSAQQRWQRIEAVLNDFNASIPTRFLPQVASGLSRQLNRQHYVPLYKLLLKKNIELDSESMMPFLWSVFCSSDVGMHLIANTDSLMRQLAAETEATTSTSGNSSDVMSEERRVQLMRGQPMFNRKFYHRMLNMLVRAKPVNSHTRSVHNHSQSVSWILENIIAQPPIEKADLQTALKLVLAWAVENDTVTTVGSILKLMTQRGIPQDEKVMTLVFRGFRLHGFDDKCTGLIRTMNQHKMTLTRSLAIELFKMVSQRYEPAVVLELFTKLVDPTQAILRQLDLVQFCNLPQSPHNTQQDHLNEENSILEHERPDELFKELDEFGKAELNLAKETGTVSLNILAQSASPFLDIVYRSVLGSQKSPEAIVELFEAYFAMTLAGKAKWSIDILDTFVEALVNLGTRKSAEAAHVLFTRAVEEMPLYKSVARNRSCRSLGLLSKLHCHGNVRQRIPVNIDLAVDLVRLAVSHPFLPVDHRLLGPIVERLEKTGQKKDIEMWTRAAPQLGALLKSSSPESKANELNTTTVN